MKKHRTKWVLAGVILCQALVFWRCFLGQKINLPLDILKAPGVYLPNTDSSIAPLAIMQSDQIFQFDLYRQFAASEMRKGNLPLWLPYTYIGAPFCVWGKYNPLNLLYVLFPSGFTLIWLHLLNAMLAAVGAFFYFRYALRVSFGPSLVGAWIYPMTGFFTLWQGGVIPQVISWFPWLLLSVDRTLHSKALGWKLGVTLTTLLPVIAGQLDVAGLLLLSAGLYALIRAFIQLRPLQAVKKLGALFLFVTFGMLLSSPYLFPLLEYSQYGKRMGERAAGKEERPPIGLRVLSLSIFPEEYGSHRKNDQFIPDGSGNMLESPAGSYIGIIATLLLAPLAFLLKRKRKIAFLWLGLSLLGLSWVLDLFPFTALMRLPGLNYLSFSRLVFLTGFGLLCLAVLGLQAIWRRIPSYRLWFLIPTLLSLGCFVWLTYRSFELPEGIVETFQMSQEVENLFVLRYQIMAILSGFIFIAWVAMKFLSNKANVLRPLLVVLCIVESLIFFSRHVSEADPSLYFPELPILKELSAMPGRSLCFGCLPANLSIRSELRDIRGYDPIEYAPFIDLLKIGAQKNNTGPTYSVAQWYSPQITALDNGEIKVHDALNMLGLRYLLFRQPLPPQTKILKTWMDYQVVENRAALPRVFIPESVHSLNEQKEVLKQLRRETFDPRREAFVTSQETIPSGTGEAEIVKETAQTLEAKVKMHTPGLVVFSELWYPGWKAIISDTEVPILRVNHALRGVVAPAGESTIQFSYWPSSLNWGIACMLFALVTLSIVFFRMRF